MAKVKKAQLGGLIKAGVKAFGKATAKSASKSTSKTAATVDRLKEAGTIANKKAPAKAFKKDLENDTYFKNLIRKSLKFGEEQKNIRQKLAPTDVQKNRSGGKTMLKRADGSYSQRGLWDNIRANKGSGKKPTAQMLKQEKKIKAKRK